MGWILSKFRKTKSTMEVLTKLETEINNIIEFKVSLKIDSFKHFTILLISGEHSSNTEEGCGAPGHIQHSYLSSGGHIHILQIISRSTNCQGRISLSNVLLIIMQIF